MPRYIDGLNECTDPQAGDQLWIVDASAPDTDKDRKVAVGKLAVLGLANTFTAAQTMPRVTMPQASFASNQTVSVGAAVLGLLVIVNMNTGAQGLVWLGGGANSVASISLRGGMTTTKDTTNNINVYYDSTYGYVIQNKYATNQTLAYVVIGAG